MPLVTETDDEYHGKKDIFGKSFFWQMETETPFVARYRENPHKPAFDVGHAAHIAILEPDRLDGAVMAGPDARSNSKEWMTALDYANFSQKLLLKPADYALVMAIRDLATTIPELDIMREQDDSGNGPMVEQSCYAVDEETGLDVKCRVDLYSPRHKLILDIKNMADASKDGWEKAVGDFGYHMQDAVYTDIWSKGSGLEVDGFWFLVFEKGDPPQVALYELTAEAVAEGHARYRRAITKTAECVKAEVWPSYPTGVQSAGMRRFGYKINPAPEESK